MDNLNIEWKQEGNKVFFDYFGKEIYFIMPEDYVLADTHPDLLKIAEHLMFSPWYDVIKDYMFSRKCGNEIGLSFSAGVDSVATMVTLPNKTELVYVQRDGIDSNVLKQDNALKMIDNMDRFVYKIKTNFELIRTNHGLPVGYSTAIAMGVPLILMGDYLNLGKISFGKVLDDQFFPKGIFRDYTKDYIVRQDLLLNAGLVGLYPLVGCSEVISCKIVEDSKYSALTFSCIRGKEGEQCNNCFKCFRKNLLRGKVASLNVESKFSISKNPPKMAPSLLYADRRSAFCLPELEYLRDLDVSCLSKAFGGAYDIYGDKEKQKIVDMLDKVGVEIMSKEEEENLRGLNFLRDKEVTRGLALP